MSTNVISRVRVTEELRDGRVIPVYEPVTILTRIKPRKYSVIINKYSPLKELSNCFDCEYKIVKFKCVEGEDTSKSTVEEQLLGGTYKIIVLQPKESEQKEFIFPLSDTAVFAQLSFRYVKIEDKLFYKCVSDENGMALLKFKYVISGEQNIVSFTTHYVDIYTLKLTKFTKEVILNAANDFKFNILLRCGILCMVWPHEKKFSVLDMNDSSATFTHYDIDEDLSVDYTVNLYGEYLQLTTSDTDFEDSVFSVKDVSKRLASYYSIHTGSKFGSKRALSDISELVYLDHATDVIFLNLPSAPLWLVMEWLLPETTLGKLIFCGVSDNFVSSIIKETNLAVLFSEYKTFFKTPNENQSNIEICHTTWKLFIWISTHHIAMISLKTLQIEGILELNTLRHDDFKADKHEFILKISRDGKIVTVVVKKNRDIVHYERFVLPEVQPLTVLAKRAVLKSYSKSEAETMTMPPLLKTRLLSAY